MHISPWQIRKEAVLWPWFCKKKKQQRIIKTNVVKSIRWPHAEGGKVRRENQVVAAQLPPFVTESEIGFWLKWYIDFTRCLAVPGEYTGRERGESLWMSDAPAPESQERKEGECQIIFCCLRDTREVNTLYPPKSAGNRAENTQDEPQLSLFQLTEQKLLKDWQNDFEKLNLPLPGLAVLSPQNLFFLFSCSYYCTIVRFDKLYRTDPTQPFFL